MKATKIKAHRAGDISLILHQAINYIGRDSKSIYSAGGRLTWHCPHMRGPFFFSRWQLLQLVWKAFIKPGFRPISCISWQFAQPWSSDDSSSISLPSSYKWWHILHSSITANSLCRSCSKTAGGRFGFPKTWLSITIISSCEGAAAGKQTANSATMNRILCRIKMCLLWRISFLPKRHTG